MVNPGLGRPPPTQAQNTPKFAKFPDAHCPEYGLGGGPLTSTTEHRCSTRRIKGMSMLVDRKFGIAQQSLLCEEQGVAFGDSVPEASF